MSPSSFIAYTFFARLNRLFVPLFVVLTLFICSCARHQEKDIQSRLIPIREANGYVVPQDSIAPSQVTILGDLPDSLQPETILLENTPPLKTVHISDNPISFTINQKSGPRTLHLAPTEKIKASLSPILQNYTTEQGFSQDVLSRSITDKKGNLWFGTAFGGIIKYDGHRFINYTTSHGLIDNGISCIIEDRAGNIWVTSGAGVSKFDGTTFSTFGKFKDVRSMLEDSEGNFWFATWSGLYKFANDSITRYSELDELSVKKVTYLDVDQKGMLWVGTDNGLFTYDTRLDDEAGLENRFKYIALRQQEVLAIFSDKSGNIWAGTQTGYIKYDGAKIISYPFTNVYYRFVYEDRLGNIWLDALGEGMWYYDAKSSDHLHKFYDLVSGATCTEDKSGNIWFSTSANGVVKYSGAAFQRLTHNSATSIFEDKGRNLWFFGYDARISRFDGEYTTRFGLSTSIGCSFQDKAGNIWMGSGDAEGLIKFENNSFTFYTDLNGLVNNWPRFITQDHNGFLWIGTGNGLSKFDGESFTNFTKKQGLAGDLVSFILEDKPGQLILGTDSGLSYFDHALGTFTNYSISSIPRGNDIRSIIKDKRGNLWMGTYGGGLCRYDGKSFYTYTTEQGLPDNVVTQVALTKEGYIILGTNNGVALLIGFKSQTNKNPNNTLAFGDIHAQTDLSNRELKKCTPVFEIYNPKTGYPVMDVNRGQQSIFEDSKGILWIASGSAKSGLMRFDYSSLFKNENPPLVNILGIKVNDEPVCWHDLQKNENNDQVSTSGYDSMAAPAYVTEEVTIFGKQLSHDQREAMRQKYKGIEFDAVSKFYLVPQHLILPYSFNKITIEFAAIEPDKPSVVQYQYKLEGYDKDWSTMANVTSATYGNIHEGRYQFYVKARSPSGIWSEPHTYTFTVLPPWWRTWWAYLMYACVLIAVVYTAFQIFKKRLILQNQLKAEQDEAVRLKELDTFKSQLFTNLTHEFRTPLTVILGMAKQLTQGTWKSIIGEKEKTRVSQGLTMIENNGKNLLQLINQLLDLSKLENKSFNLQNIQGDIIPYVRYVTDSFQSYAEDIGLSIRFSSAIESLVMDFDPEQMKQVLTNLISNALKFTPSDNEINVKLNHVEGQLLINVIDTGIGISEKDLPHVLDRFYQADSSTTRVAQGTGIGLAHTQELLKVMGGSISIQSELGKGTNVTVQLPIMHEAPIMERDEMALPSMSHAGITKPKAEPVTDDPSLNSQEAFGNEYHPQLLIIEDNSDVVAYLKSCLEDEYRVSAAFNGRAGVNMALETIPDFIISDVMMPEMDGYQVCDKLKNDERTSHIPIILLTAKADASSRLVGLRRGADAYMAKPFSPEELSLQISTLLENRRRMAAYFSRGLRSDSTISEMPGSILEAIQVEDAFIKKVNSIIEENYTDEEFSLPQLSKDIGMSRSQLFRKIKAVADTNPSDMIRSFRLHKARSLLVQGDLTVAEVTYKVGFKDPSYFSKLFQEEFGVQPSAVIS